MAEEIKIAMRESPHRLTNAKVFWDHLTLTNNLWMPGGWRFRDGDHGRLLLYLPAIPAEIHATTPNGKIRIRWVTASASGNAIKLYLDASDVEPDVDSYDPAAFDYSNGLTDTSAGAGICNTRTFDLSTINLAAGREIIAVLRRDRQTPDASDTLAADILVTSVLFVADKA